VGFEAKVTSFGISQLFYVPSSKNTTFNESYKQQMKTFGWRQALLALAFLLSLSVVVIFVVRAVRPAIYWHYHQDEPIRGWMNVGYVAHSYHVPPHVLYQALGMPHTPPDRRPLREIAKAQNRSMDELRKLLLDAIVHSRPPYPPPPPADPGSSP
jgi:hypothetical protein